MKETSIKMIDEYVVFRYGDSVLRVKQNDIEKVETSYNSTLLHTKSKTFKLNNIKQEELDLLLTR